MGAAEVAHRIRELSKKTTGRLEQGWPRYGSRAPVRPVLDVRDLYRDNGSNLTQSASTFVAGNFRALGRDWPSRSEWSKSEYWSVDPTSGQNWKDSGTYCFAIGYRGGELGDAKFPWELNRLQHLQAVALQNSFHADPFYVEFLAGEISSWHETFPPFLGLPWASGIEVALRSISLVVVSSVCDRSLTEKTLDQIRQILIASRHWLRKFPSLHSSANNHLLAELAGQVVIDCALEESIPPDLIAELVRQFSLLILSDGTPAEQSPSYGGFAVELMLVAARALKSRNIDLPTEVRQRLCAFNEFVQELRDDHGVPDIGDNDAGRVLVDCFDQNYVVRLAEWALRADDRGGCECRTTISAPRVRTFPEGGYSVMTNPRNSDPAYKLIFDHGPLGYLSIAAHGHADALSILLTIRQQPVFIDAGTYLYHGAGEWRSILRSTALHNTAQVNGQDQSTMSGNFNWSTHAKATLLMVEEECASVRVVASHDGYMKRFGVTHQRSVDCRDKFILIEDLFSGPQCSPHIHFLLSQAIQVRIMPALELFCEDRRLATVSVENGTIEVIEGWYAPSFGVLTPTKRLRVTPLNVSSPVSTKISF
ncbi:heparinase II/III family protein [Ramlibacter sp. MMS24-I3-19]|uniref:heparinase II/III family protein n=1 Tax=Ramlibacter sp. MMS24-I3-19 TaxID=3416606 RepID=UPI003D00784A